MALQPVDQLPALREQVSAAEWEARVALAAGHRVLAHYGVNDMTYNHFSLRVPGEPEHLLVKRTDWMFSEVTASSLQKYDMQGNPKTPGVDKPLSRGALVIHAGLLRERTDLNAVLHTHTPAMMGVSAHRCGLLPVTQHAMRFYGEMKYHDFQGFEFDLEMTGRLLTDLEGGKFMLLRNHGGLVCGASVAECLVSHHWLEMACQGQVAAVAGGPDSYCVPDPEACQYAHDQIASTGDSARGLKDWNANLRLAERLDPGFKD